MKELQIKKYLHIILLRIMIMFLHTVGDKSLSRAESETNCTGLLVQRLRSSCVGLL